MVNSLYMKIKKSKLKKEITKEIKLDYGKLSIDAHKKSIALFPKEQMQESMKLFGAAPKGNYYIA